MSDGRARVLPDLRLRHLCVDMCIDMFIEMCIDMCIDIYMSGHLWSEASHMWAHIAMRQLVPESIYTYMCVQASMDTCAHILQYVKIRV